MEGGKPLLVLVAGMSGAGKSSTLETLADAGFFACSNLPVALLDNFLNLFQTQLANRFTRLALLLDLDTSEKITQLTEALAKYDLAIGGSNTHLIFLECRPEVAIRRYSETRRPHPGFNPAVDKSLQGAIMRERERLNPLRDLASRLIDTSALNIHDLKNEVVRFAQSLTPQTASMLRVNFVSFGFKHGVPIDCDLLVDVRVLPNPHFVDGLRQKTGVESEVSEYVLNSKESQEFVDRYENLLRYLIPLNQAAAKASLNIAIGCTGGKHRSVAVAEELRRRLSGEGLLVSASHRDFQRVE